MSRRLTTSGEMKVNKLKTATKAVLLLVVISLHGDFVEDKMKQEVKSIYQPIIAKHKSYLSDGVLERVTFQAQSRDGEHALIERHGSLRLKQNAPATILICHGFMCDKYDISFLRTVFNNYNVMTFDFRAHGEKIENQLCTLGKEEAFDVIGAVKYIKSRPELANKPLIAYGFSMGSVSAIEAQAKEKNLFDAMILDCPFDSSDSVVKKGIAALSFSIFGYEIPLPGRALLQQYAYNPYVQAFAKVLFKSIAKLDATATATQLMKTDAVESIEHISVPCYFITCKNDEKVDLDGVVSIYAGAKGYKRLWISNGRRHFDSFFYNPEKYTHKVNKFVSKIVNGNWQQDLIEKIVADPEIG